MKNFRFCFVTLSAIFIVSFSEYSFSQEIVNPFDKHKNQYNSLDFISAWSNPNLGIQEQIYGYDWIRGLSKNTNSWTRVLPLSPEKTIGNETGSGYIVLETGNFNGDEKDDVFYLIERNGYWEYGAAQQISAVRVSDSLQNFTLLTPTFVASSIQVGSHPDVAIGDFNGDGIDEAVVCMVDNSGYQIHFELISFSSNGDTISPHIIGDEVYDNTESGGDSKRFPISICAADLNGDGTDEICYSGIENNTTNSEIKYNAFMRVVDVMADGSFQFVQKAKILYDTLSLRRDPVDENGGNISYVRTALTKVRPYYHIKNQGPESVFAALAFAWSTIESSGLNYDYLHSYTITASSNLDSLIVKEGPAVHGTNSDYEVGYPLEAHTGDMNNDNIDDVVTLTRDFHVFTFDSLGVLTLENTAGHHPMGDLNDGSIQESVDRFDIGDVDRDGRADLVSLTKTFDGVDVHTVYLQVFGVDSLMHIVERGVYQSTFNSGTSISHYGFALGNLDGTDLHLGDPVNIKECEYYRPSVVLGCVPYHFDIINGEKLDIRDGNSSVTISNQSSTSKTASILVSASYAESESVNAQYAYEGTGGGASASKESGSGFSHSSSNGVIKDFEFNLTASGDDYFLGGFYPFSMFEYPVLNANNDTTSWIIAIIPSGNFITRETSSANILNYIPNHEVGNLLSYPKINNESEIYYNRISDMPSSVLWSPNEMTVSSGGTSSTSLRDGVNEALSNSVSAWESGTFEANVSVAGFGMGGGYSETNSYRFDELQVFSQEISKVQEFNVTTGKLIEGNFDYTIKPFLYITEERNLEMSMGVNLDAFNIKGSEWKSLYGQKADPALNMPWRLDAAKSASYLPELLDRTRSIRVSKVNPNPGDTLTLYIRIFNYSLMDMTEKVKFLLYNGNPDKGGTLIEDIYGNTNFDSGKILEGQGRNVVEVSVVVTIEMVGGDKRVYIKLDPDNEIDEIHEDNNLAWTNLGFPCNIPGDIPLGIPEFSMKENNFQFNVYPNPSTDKITLYNTSELKKLEGNLSLQIYNMSGRLVLDKPVVNVELNSFTVDISSLLNGIYIYKLNSTNKSIYSGKIVVSK